MQFNSLIARAAMTALFIGASAQATILNEYSNLSAWTAATTGSVTSESFTGSNMADSTSAGLTYGSVRYAGFYNEGGTSSGFFTYRLQTPFTGFQNTTGSYLLAGSSGGIGDGTNNTGLRTSLLSLSNITALAFNFSAYRVASVGNSTIYSTTTNPINLTMQLFESNVLTETKILTVPEGSLGFGFYGFTTTGNITGVTLRLHSPSTTELNRVAIDNFAYATAAAQSGGGGGGGGEIPEPSTYLLCGAALFGVALLRRKTI